LSPMQVPPEELLDDQSKELTYSQTAPIFTKLFPN